MLGRSSTRSNSMVLCKKHPKHRQSPGVCSLCLADKLSRVSTTSESRDRYTARARAYYCSSSSISSSEDESSYPSSSASPMHEEEGYHRRIASDVNVKAKAHTNAYFSKSKSMAFVENEEGKLRDQEKKKERISGFWSKLLRPRRNGKRVNADNVVDRKLFMLSQSQPLAASSSSTAVY